MGSNLKFIDIFGKKLTPKNIRQIQIKNLIS